MLGRERLSGLDAALAPSWETNVFHRAQVAINKLAGFGQGAYTVCRKELLAPH